MYILLFITIFYTHIYILNTGKLPQYIELCFLCILIAHMDTYYACNGYIVSIACPPKGRPYRQALLVS